MATKTALEKKIDNVFEKIIFISVKSIGKIFLLVSIIVLTLIKNTLKKGNEKFLFLITTIIIALYLVWKSNLNLGLYLYIIIPILCYFILRAFIITIISIISKYNKNIKIKILNKKHKNIVELFENKVSVVKVTQESITLFCKGLGVKTIQSKHDLLESYTGRHIKSITRSVNDLKYVILKFKKNTNYKKFYKFEEFINYLNQKLLDEMYLPFMTGIDENGVVQLNDLTKIKHLFVSGESDGGKSTIVNVILQSLMVLCNNIVFILIDLKEGIELSDYENFNNCIVIDRKDKLLKTLETVKNETTRRLREIRNTPNCKSITAYNTKSGKNMPYMVVVIDEIAEIKLGNEEYKIVEECLITILQQGRAGGVYVIGATQRPSANLLNSNVRAGFLYNIAFKVTTIETEKMTKLEDLKDLKVGEYKATFTDREEIYKGLLVLEEKNVKKKLPKCNLVFEILEKILTKTDQNIKIKCKENMTSSHKKDIKTRFLDKLFCHKLARKVFKSYFKSYSSQKISITFKSRIKQTENVVISEVERLKKILNNNENSVGNKTIETSGITFEECMKYLYKNKTKNNTVPAIKMTISDLKIGDKKLRAFKVDGAKKELLYLSSKTNYSININSKLWEDILKK
jgi:hypothetical protein